NMNLNNRISCVNSCMSGSNSILGSIGQFVATQYDAKLKEQEGDVERIRATQQMLESLDENLKALIQKALASQDAIQQNMNQTRTRILG
ncbi:MAG: type III secretion system protein, partial [Mailhella sp.]|nr:type III secretion system protein [Mailhella sp.]